MTAPPDLRSLVAGRSFLVTGTAGFLGRAVAERLLREGAAVEALTRSDCDLQDREAVRRRLQDVRPDAVLHLAAGTDRTRDLDRLADLARANVWGTLHLLEALPEGTRVIHAGTLEEYGSGPGPFLEDQGPAPWSPYSLTKMAAGHLVVARGGTHVRLSLVYGPGQSRGFLVPQLLEALRTGKPLEMTQGEQKRDFLWLADAAEGLVRIAACPDLRGEAVNLCTGVGTRLRDLVALLERLAGRPLPVRFGAVPYREDEVFECVGSPGRLEVRTGWRPQTSLEEGLRLLLAHSG